MGTMSFKKISKQKDWDNLCDNEEQLLILHQWEWSASDMYDSEYEEIDQDPQYYK